VSRTKKITKLSDLQIDEVSLVDRGANQHAELLISKRDEEGEEVDKANPDQSDVTMGEGDEELEEEEDKGFFKRLVDKMFGDFTTSTYNDGNIADMDDVEKAGLMPGMQMPYGHQPMGMPAPGPQNAMPGPQAFPAGPGQMPGQMQAAPPLPDEVIQYIQQLEEALAQAQGGDQQQMPSGDQEEEDVNPFGKNDNELTVDDYEFLQELSKNLENEDNREAIQKALEAVEKANARAEEAESIAKAEREHRLNQEYVAKARAYTNLPVSADEFGPVLKKIHESLDESEFELMTKVLSSANETIADMRVFDEIGKRGVQGYEAVSKADAQAAEVAKSEGISQEAALSKVFEQNPGLYDEYLKEVGR